MSSNAFLEWEPDTIGVPVAEWQEFCAEHGIDHSPQTGGGNVFYAGKVEISWDCRHSKDITQPAHSLTFSTYFCGEETPMVSFLALQAWKRWGGQLNASPEVRNNIDARKTW